MLYLLSHNKASQHVEFEGVKFNLRDIFKTKEDSFTSSIFSLLFYLPPRMFWNILYQSCYKPSLPNDPGKVVSYQFWPRWDSKGTVNQRIVEPDLFVEFEEFHLIVEAKRYDYENAQLRSQWEKEVISYFNQYSSEERKPLFFLAVGGLPSGMEVQKPIRLNESDTEILVTFTRWKRILNEVKKHHEHYLNVAVSCDTCIEYILKDLLLAFRIHGFVTGDLFKSMPKEFTISNTSLSRILRSRNIWSGFPKELKYLHHIYINPLYEDRN